MPFWAWIIIGVVVVAIIAVAVWQISARRRSRRLRDRFGREYDHTIRSSDSKSDAERELARREERRRTLHLRPLSAASRDRYLESWRETQAQFVDSPVGAVASADALIQSVMADRGYPVEDFEQRAADVSVDHPDVVQNYREGRRLAQLSASGQASTEDLRMAMRHYRALFDELLEPAKDQLAA